MNDIKKTLRWTRKLLRTRSTVLIATRWIAWPRSKTPRTRSRLKKSGVILAFFTQGKGVAKKKFDMAKKKIYKMALDENIKTDFNSEESKVLRSTAGTFKLEH
ncbi:hypothetical protein V7S43_018238 [Phytophthora oleae]|uniref:RxLR effector protein n=1 Tax=Phytophthora oleae TaxID=2107226 RepID=A0ABD3ET90_9STRA